MSAEHRDVDELIDALETVLAGDVRARLLDALTVAGGGRDPHRRLRAAMVDHRFVAKGPPYDFARLVRRLDGRTRQDGFRVLHAWNHRTHAFTDDIVPALILDFLERTRGTQGASDTDVRTTASIVLDYYFLHLLTLCATRVWDTADPDTTLDRLTSLVALLQGEAGSGHQFVSDSATLLIYALSQFHPEETAYDRVIERVRGLNAGHQLRFASVSASVLSAHLRWGFWLMYGRDVVRMRRDNTGDYPWLLNSVLTLMKAYVADDGADDGCRQPIVQSLLQGLAADPWAFTGSPPPALADHRGEYDELLGLLREHGARLLGDLPGQAPDKKRYSPLALHFNFPHNTLVAIVTLALLEGRPQTLPLNALFVPEIESLPEGETQEGLARTLMAFSRGSPDRLGHRGAMLVAYDPLSALRSYNMTVETLEKAFG